MSESLYEIFIDVPKEVENYDIVEAIEENFEGSLGDRNVALDDPCRQIIVHMTKQESFENNDGGKMNNFIYKITVRNDEVACGVIEGWKIPANFDELAFRHSKSGILEVRVKDIKRIV